jgi:tetraacyldisaccharide-1-P 4'-kinase
VFCAIAKPDQFVGSIAALGLDIATCEFLSDHSSFSPELLQEIATKAKASGAIGLICTEKDMVKLSVSTNPAFPIYCLKIGIEIMTPAIWQEFCLRLVRS